jgi:3'-phosphoadenosine 5'-phosphosulfate sulfotransferase (PAPS reductase)/FAD synthetase
MCNATEGQPAKAKKGKKAKPAGKPIPHTVRVRLERYDWIVVNSSAGKDSQAMLHEICRQASALGILDRVVVVHADLGRVEWKGTRELAEEQAKFYGVRFVVVRRKQGDLLDHVRARAAKLRADGKLAPAWPSSTARYCTSHHKENQVAQVLTQLVEETRSGASPWPSSTARYCTSDHKRGQVATAITALVKERPARDGRRVRVLNCMGLRAAESSARSKKLPFQLNANQTNGKRVVHTYLPIFGWSVAKVWETIKASGCPSHYAYELGMPRLSCCFCIFAPKNALMLAGKHNPELLAEYVKVEQEVGSKFRVELPLAEVKAALDRGEEPGEIQTWEM